MHRAIRHIFALYATLLSSLILITFAARRFGSLFAVRRIRMAALVGLVGFVTACAGSDRALVYTEEGLRAAEQGWDANYESEATRCEGLHEPKTPEMEECFGKTYDANAAVGIAVQSSVALLRAYWRRRAAGEKPDLSQVLLEIQAIFDDLPPEAKQFFDRVRGIP